MKIARILILALGLAVTAPALEIRTGILIHDIADLWGYTKIERGIDLNAEIILGQGMVRPNFGASINSKGYTSCAYSGILFALGRNHWIADFGFGLAFQVNAVRKLGSSILFRLAAEIGYSFGRHRLSLILDHLSNGAGFFGWKIPNAGRDDLGIRWGYRWGPA